jgi:hypothetical protein
MDFHSLKLLAQFPEEHINLTAALRFSPTASVKISKKPKFFRITSASFRPITAAYPAPELRRQFRRLLLRLCHQESAAAE